MIHKKTIGICTLLCMLGGSLHAQNNTITTGGNASGASGTTSFTVGQVFYKQVQKSSSWIHQGLQQPFEFFETFVAESFKDEVSLSVFPNPTTRILNLTFHEFNNEDLYYELINSDGKVLKSQVIIAEHSIVNLAELPSSVYFINIFKNNQRVKSFQIIKN